jgi:Chitin binding Peritrophin-A domain
MMPPRCTAEAALYRTTIAYRSHHSSGGGTGLRPAGGGDCDVVCAPGDHYLPNPSDCGSFYQCNDGVPMFQPCPAGLVFNPNIKLCDWPSSYPCTPTC